MPTEEAIVALTMPRDSVPLATHVRGTLIVTSLQLVRSLGLEAQYFEALPASEHEAVRGVLASEWVPMSVATAHYAALDTLGLASSTITEIGRQAAVRVHGNYLRTLLQSVRITGAIDPITLLSRLQPILDRTVRGGTAAAYRVGPKDVRAELLGIPAFRYDYLRNGWAGAFQASLELVARKVHVNELRRMRTENGVAYQISWV